MRDPTSGVLGGAAAGAMGGAMAGPIGAAVGAAVGAIAGGLAGNSIAASVDQQQEQAYWRDNFRSRPYAEGADYDDYGPAYAYAVERYVEHRGRSFDTAESELARDWGNYRGSSRLGWDRARHASRDAWERLDRVLPRAPAKD